MPATTDTSHGSPAPDSHRLDDAVAPRHYDLDLSIDLAAGTFGGTVGIDLDVRRGTDTITLHSLDLDLDAPTVASGGSTRAATVEADPSHEWVVLRLADPLPPGPARLDIAFRGVLGDQLVGLYRSTFTVDGVEQALAVTQFESTHARRAFPCFDEPAFKATFAISLTVDDGLLAVSNAAEVGRAALPDGRIRIEFAPTMVMSTYLVAFVVGPLEVTEAHIVAGREAPIPLRVVHPPGQAHLCAFALEVADAGLRFLEDYYDIAYPGDKVDLVAVPDFAFGAMENLGCITFREVLLLVDPAGATPRELQNVADVINHELAHMWFGDLVTMGWWNGIWLNEAFATFMEVSATDAFRPDWDVWTNFGLARATAFDTDALPSTRPIEYPVLTAEDAEAMFDVLTYEKGCSVVRMLEQYLGAEVFRDGIRTYLRRHAHANTETTDLWDALEEVSGEPVRRIMDQWIFRGGHPVVRAELNGSRVELSQARAAYPVGDGDGGGGGADAAPWPTPVVMAMTTVDGSTSTHRVLLEAAHRLELPGAVAAVQPNDGGNGFYRSRVDAGSRRHIAGTGSPLERFTLLDDTWFAVLCGDLAPEQAEDLVAQLALSETEPAVWRRMAAVVAERHRLADDATRAAVQEWVRTVLGPATTRFPAGPDTGGERAEVAGIVLSTLGVTGADDAVRSDARSLFARDDLHPAIAAAALDVVAATASPDEHAEILLRWTGAPTPQDELRHLSALVATADPTLFAHALGLVRDDVRSQDAPYLLRRALANLHRGPDAWAYLVQNWAGLLARFPSSSHPRMLEGIRGFTDADLAAEVEAFLTGHPLEAGQQQVRQHLDRMWATVAAAQRVRSNPVTGD